MVKGELQFYQKRHLTEKGGEGGSISFDERLMVRPCILCRNEF